MKKAFMLLGLAALVLATSCERENLNKVDSTPQTFDGDVAYIVVNINDVNDVATRGGDGGFEYGTADEYAVNDAHFYFYGGSDAEFVAEATYVPDGEAQETPVGNIEWKGNTVVALHGLSGTSYPNWVVTVLNKPAGFTAPNKLTDFATALAENSDGGYGTPGEYGIYTKGAVEVVNDPAGTGAGEYYFTMCTSSFNPSTDRGSEGYSSTYYYATPVVEANFALEDLTEEDGVYYDANGEAVPPITIYVERLVAKTRVGLGSDLLSGATTDADGNTYYEISVSEDADGTVTDYSLYVRLEGWELNGVSNETYMAKRIDTSWDLGFTWNDASYYRSYWAMSTAYGDADPTIWPDSSEGNDYDNAKGMNPYLRWFDYDYDYMHQIGVIDQAGNYDCQYCGENTNTALGTSDTGVINSKRHSAITNALIAATIGELDDEGNFTASTLVRVNGTLYTLEGYLNYAASHIYLYTKYVAGADDPDYDEGTIIFTQLGPEYLTVETSTDGYVYVCLDQDALSDANITALYESTNEDDEGVTLTAADSYIQSHFNEVYGYGANGYNEGMMYYSIPIEHLDSTEMEEGEDGIEIPYEGSYGMVRNHIYSITITAIENIGWGVWDPDEVIIVQEDQDTYSLTAQINILSWKLVEQSVTL